ncbi:hypothetical protein [Reyranella sp.]|uniref:hypothetical protein n=1 Tax=Reyranella sp. TaxID=1929291 RepID=UPI003BAD0F34
MQPEVLALPDPALVERMHVLEGRTDGTDPHFERFRSVLTQLSRDAWQALTDELDCDRGPLAEVGVMVFPLDPGLAGRLLAAMLSAPRTRIRRRDFAPGYMSTATAQCDYLNSGNQYRKLTPASRALLAEFMVEAGPLIERMIGHPYRIASTRQFQLIPRRPAADRHLDGWPVAMRKIFILPQGCGTRSGTTWFRRRDGVEFTLESDAPVWMLFENSVVLHAPISGVALRPTIEFDIVPARQTSFEVVDAGIGGWYPYFPTEQELQRATRSALERFLEEMPEGAPVETWRQRLARSLARLRPRRG